MDTLEEQHEKELVLGESLHAAVIKGDATCISAMLEAGADINFQLPTISAQQDSPKVIIVLCVF